MRRALLTFTVLALVGIAMSLLASRPRRLEDAGTPIHPSPKLSIRDYWLSDEEILTVEDAGGMIAGRRALEARRQNVFTGFAKPIPGLNRVIRALQKRRLGVYLTGWTLSPDRRWLLAAEQPDHTSCAYLAVELASGRVRRYPRPGLPVEFWSSVVWDHDSRGWTRLIHSSARGLLRMDRYALDSPGVVQRGAFRKAGRLSQIAGRIDSERILASEDSSSARGIASLTVVGQAGDKTCRVNLHNAANLHHAVLSPDGRALAWMVLTVPDAGWAWARPLLGRLGLAGVEYMSIRTSRWDGSDMREIARTRVSVSRLSLGLTWTPSGDRISFQLGEILWVVPAH